MAKWASGQMTLMGMQVNRQMDVWRDEMEGCCFSSAEIPSSLYHLCDQDV